MVRIKYFDKRDQLLSLSLHDYYSLTFLRVESKDWTNNKFRLDRNRRRKKIRNGRLPSSIIKSKAQLGVLLDII